MTSFKFLCAMGVALLPLGCGGGDPGGPGDCLDEACANEAEAEAEAESEGQPTTGFLVATAQPALPGAVPFQLFVDNEMMVEVATGGAEGRIEVDAGPHDVKIVCPGYGYAVDGYTWYSDSQSVSDWVMSDLVVSAGQTTTVNAMVCRDLTGRWQIEGTSGTPNNVTLASDQGVCSTLAMPLTNFTIQGNNVRPSGGTGDWIPILDNGRRIEVEDIIILRVD